jgi:hypothetical protein
VTDDDLAGIYLGAEAELAAVAAAVDFHACSPVSGKRSEPRGGYFRPEATIAGIGTR